MIRIICKNCNRDLQFSPAMLDRNPVCMYCGEQQDINPEFKNLPYSKDVNSIDKILRVTCLVCNKIFTVKNPETEKTAYCIYCSCPNYIINKSGKVTISASKNYLLKNIPKEFKKLNNNLKRRLKFKDSLIKNQVLKQSFEVLSHRLIRKHASIDEFKELYPQIISVSRMLEEEEWEDINSPLTPLNTMNLLANTIGLGKKINEIPSQPENGSSLTIITGKTNHKELEGWAPRGGSKEFLKRAAVAAAVTAVTGGNEIYLPKWNHEDEESYYINHILRIIMIEDPCGSYFSYITQFATGQEMVITEAQLKIIQEIPLAVYHNSLKLIAFKSIFGRWIDTSCSRHVNKESLKNWLANFPVESELICKLCIN